MQHPVTTRAMHIGECAAEYLAFTVSRKDEWRGMGRFGEWGIDVVVK